MKKGQIYRCRIRISTKWQIVDIKKTEVGVYV